VGKDHDFKKVNDEGTGRALFPPNYCRRRESVSPLILEVEDD
jgi:hypothetical protein